MFPERKQRHRSKYIRKMGNLSRKAGGDLAKSMFQGSSLASPGDKLRFESSSQASGIASSVTGQNQDCHLYPRL